MGHQCSVAAATGTHQLFISDICRSRQQLIHSNGNDKLFSTSRFCVLNRAKPESNSCSLFVAAQFLKVTFTVSVKTLQSAPPQDKQTAHWKQPDLERALH